MVFLLCKVVPKLVAIELDNIALLDGATVDEMPNFFGRILIKVKLGHLFLREKTRALKTVSDHAASLYSASLKALIKMA
jgi:hypothetical protein